MPPHREFLLVQIDRCRLAHQASELPELRIHFFHLLFQMALINRSHLLRVFRLQQTLRELESRSYICLGKCNCLFVHLLRT